MLLREFIGVRAPSDLGEGGGGGTVTFVPEKIRSARMPEFCNQNTKALIFYEKENRLLFSHLVKRL